VRSISPDFSSGESASVHPLVRQETTSEDTTQGDSTNTTSRDISELPVFDQISLISDYASTFAWYSQLSSVGQVSGNLSLCSGNATIFYNKTEGVLAEYERQYYGEAGKSTYKILKSIDPIIYSCYFTVFEYYIALSIYGQTLSDGNKLLYNFSHNLGSIYDLTEEAIYKIQSFDKDWESQEYWKRMGIIFGTNFQNLLEEPINYSMVEDEA